MPQVSLTEYAIYWVGAAVCLVIGLIAGVVSMIRQRRKPRP
jgi:cytochrome oxidase assembly protein ShyY1